MRADARRNRERVLAAARTLFAAEGVDVPIDDVARKAGVGAGTVWRHFPSKESLIEAVLVSRIERLRDRARELVLDRGDTVEASPGLFRFLRDMLFEGYEKRDLVFALSSAGAQSGPALTTATAELDDALTTLVVQSQDAGTVRNDVTGAEVIALVYATLLAIQRSKLDPDRHEHVLNVLVDGLTSHPDRRSPQPSHPRVAGGSGMASRKGLVR